MRRNAKLLPDNFDDKIRKLAYEKFVKRNYQHGHDVDDWLAAENEVIDDLFCHDLYTMMDEMDDEA